MENGIYNIMNKKHKYSTLLLIVIFIIMSSVSCTDRVHKVTGNADTEDYSQDIHSEGQSYENTHEGQVVTEGHITPGGPDATDNSSNETPSGAAEDPENTATDVVSDHLGIYCFPLDEGSEAELFTHRIIEIAMGEPEIAENSDRTTKYGTYFGDPAGEWCTEFALWCIIQAQNEFGEYSYNYRSLYPHSDWAEGCIDWYRERKRFYRPWELLPRCGDMVFFDTDSDEIGDHTGLVVDLGYDFELEKDYIITIEGNIPGDRPSNKIRQRKFYLDDKLILGFGTFSENDLFQ